MVSLLLLLACSGAPTSEAPPPPAPEAPEAPEVPGAAPAAPEAAAEATADRPPGGVVGGMPILERPVILGGIDNAAVEAALDADALQDCNTAGRPGKVLLRFRIDRGGQVVTVETKSSTLRHPETETCLQERVRGTAFPELERGESAIVTWPFDLHG